MEFEKSKGYKNVKHNGKIKSKKKNQVYNISEEWERLKLSKAAFC